MNFDEKQQIMKTLYKANKANILSSFIIRKGKPSVGKFSTDIDSRLKKYFSKIAVSWIMKIWRSPSLVERNLPK